MSDGMGREFTYLSSHATNRYFIPNWGTLYVTKGCSISISNNKKRENKSFILFFLLSFFIFCTFFLCFSIFFANCLLF